MGPFDRAATERATTPRDTSDGIVTSTNEVRGPEEIGVLDGPLGARREIEHQEIELSPLEGPEDLAEERRTPVVARHVWDSPCAALSKSSASDSGTSEPIEKTPIPLVVRGSATLSAAGHERRAP